MYTRSHSVKRSVSTSHSLASKDNQHWTQAEEREMVRLRRLGNLSFHEIATQLHRSPEAINLRFRKLVDEHVGDDDVSRKEVLRWFNLTE
jgi:hypothetical protein